MIENMTSQFIQQNNQNLLWKIINNTPQMINFFGGGAPGEKERWFQQIIGHVYEQNVGSNLGIRDLNKIAIDLMVDLLKKAQAQAQHQTQSQHQTQTLVPNPIEKFDNHQKPHVINKPGSHVASSMENQFELRRKEYENMTKKPVPTHNFTENVKDEAIGDIGLAVNEYMKQRDMDSKMFAPKEPVTPVSIEIEEIDDKFSAKKVKWGENVEHVYKENEGSKDLSSIAKSEDLSSIAKILEMLGTLSKKVDEQGEMIKTLIEKK